MMIFLRYPVLGVLLTLLLFSLQPPAAAAAGPAGAYRQATRGYRQLLASPRKQRYRENWLRVVKHFAAVGKRYPSSRQAADALFMAGKASAGLYSVSRVKKDARLAVTFYDRLAARYPRSSLADDALVRAGALEERPLGDFPAAYARYARVVKDFPAGDMVGRARKKLKSLTCYAPATHGPAPTPIVGGKTLSSAAAGARLTGIRYWSTADYTRVVLDLNRQADYTSNQLPANPAQKIGPRLYLDIPGSADPAVLAATTNVDDGVVKQIRTGQPQPDKVRVVLDLDSFADYKIFTRADPFRIVIDVASGTQRTGKAGSAGKDGIAGVLAKVPPERPLQVHIPTNRPTRLRRIVVDAGHGGKDPGAIGPDGVMEKSVTLAIAKALAPRLEKAFHCEVILTRNGDVFLPLQERTAIANKVRADLFISIHANACPDPKTYGIETYYLNFSKNAKAVAVAARENGTSLRQVGDLEQILFDLMANAKINESSRLAAEIQKSLVDNLEHSYRRIKDLGVRQGPFYVLLGATMPSVLVETSFISNPREETRLTERRYQDRIADAIVKGVRQYATSLKMIANK